MPRKPFHNTPLDEFLPGTRCTPQMKEAVDTASETLGISAGNVVRGCVAYVLGIDEENAELVKRMLRRGANGNGEEVH